MTITNSFRDAVANGNVKGVRIMMKDSLLVDPSFAEFNEMSRLAAKLNGLYDPHDGREFQNNASAWTDDYMDKLMVQVVGNFSKERLEHLKAVVKHLRPIVRKTHTPTTEPGRMDHNPRPRTQTSQNRGYQERKWRDQQDGNIRMVKVACGTVGGAVVGGTAAAVINTNVIGGAFFGAVVGTVVMAVLTEGE